MANGEDRKWTMWVIGLFMSLALGFTVYSSGRMDAMQSALAKDYVQRAEFTCAIERIEKNASATNDKIDKIYDHIIKTERRK